MILVFKRWHTKPILTYLLSSFAAFPSTPTAGCSSQMYEWKGFKIVGDNINKNIHFSYQRIGWTTLFIHYFHAYAVLDRVDFSGLSDVSPSPSIVDPLKFLLSQSDIHLWKQNFAILISGRMNCNIRLWIFFVCILYYVGY